MQELLMRDAAPFGEDTWHAIDEMIVTVLKKSLVGRQIVDLVGPLGWGVEQAPLFSFDGASAIAGDAEYLKLQELSAEFTLRAKHLAMAAQTPFGLDLGAVAIAATNLAKQEDDLVVGGLLQAEKASGGSLGDWEVPNGPFSALQRALSQLRTDGYAGPFTMLLSPTRYAQLAGLVRGPGGQRELDLVQSVLGRGVYQSTSMPDDRVIVTSPQASPEFGIDWVVSITGV